MTLSVGVNTQSTPSCVNNDTADAISSFVFAVASKISTPNSLNNSFAVSIAFVELVSLKEYRVQLFSYLDFVQALNQSSFVHQSHHLYHLHNQCL